MRTKTNQAGYVIVTVALLLVVLLGFTALAIDIGILYSARTQSQAAADAAALAGAVTFILDGNIADQPGRAILQAKKVGAMNNTLRTPITEDEVAVSVDIPNRQVTVNIARVEPTFFAKILNFNSANVSVEAIAEAALDIGPAQCVKPIFIPNTIGAPNGQTLCDACAANQKLVTATGAPNAPYGTETVASGGWLGRQMSIRPGQPNGAISPGQFYSIRVGGPGGDEYREAWASCSTVQYQCGNSYPVEPGAMVGPTRQGIEGQNPDQAGLLANSPGGNPDTWQDIGEYLHGGQQPPFDLSQQLVLTPVVDLCQFCPSGDFPTGTGTLTIAGFALMFVDGFQGTDVFAHLVDVKGCDGPSGTLTGSPVFATPLRLVHN